jgi:hypothetical protein
VKASLFNKYTEKEKEEILSHFKKPRTFRLLNIKPDPENKGQLLLPGYKNVPPKDVIFDEEGNPSHIAYITGQSPDGEAQFGNDLVFTKGNWGMINLNPKKPKDQNKFIYLYTASYNKSSPIREGNDGSEYGAPLYYLIDYEKEASLRRDKRESFKRSVRISGELEDKQVDELYTILSGMSAANKSVSEKRDYLEDYAQSTPDKFLKAYDAKTNTIEAFVREAISQKVIAHNSKEGTFVSTDNGSVLFTYKTGFGVKAYDLFTEHLAKSKEKFIELETLVQIKNTKV